MKNLGLFFFCFLLISCNGMHFNKVESRSLGSYKYPNVNREALFELVKLYENSDKKKRCLILKTTAQNKDARG